MTKSETYSLIQAAGGDSEFGRLLGLDGKPGFQQRINNWKRRGMPSAVELAHYDVIQRLRAKAGTRVARARKATKSSATAA